MQKSALTERIQSVDIVRVLAILGVIIIHTQPFIGEHVHPGMDFNLGVLLNQFARFAVPFFFVISGYFWASKFDEAKSLTRPTVNIARRIAVIFFAWSAIYLLPTNLLKALEYGPLGPIKTIYWNLNWYLRVLIDDPVNGFMQGTKGHLWFLMSLLCSLAISAVLLARNMKRTLIALSLILYLIGLFGKAYADTPFGFHSNFNFRNGPFFGLIFFVSGYILNRIRPKASWFLTGLVLTAFGFCLHFLELFMLKYYWNTTTIQDYVVGTYFVGIGVALIALANPPFLRMQKVFFIGPMVLGIYAIHLVFVDLLSPFGKSLSGNILWEVGYPVAVFLLSLAATYAMSRSRLTKAIVI